MDLKPNDNKAPKGRKNFRQGAVFRSPRLEAITRLVADSLARHGFDRPVDPRRLQWSRWFRCDSTHSLFVVPSKPGIFALAEEVMDLGSSKTPVPTDREGHDFSRAAIAPPIPPDSAAEGTADGTHIAEAPIRRMLAVIQFSEDDDMAFTLDRMFTCVNPMRARLASGRCFLRFVVIEDQAQRRNICNALNQWMLSSAEKATGITTDFQSLELIQCGADALVRHCRQHYDRSPGIPARPRDRSAPGRASRFRSQQKPSLSSSPTLGLLNQKIFNRRDFQAGGAGLKACIRRSSFKLGFSPRVLDLGSTTEPAPPWKSGA